MKKSILTLLMITSVFTVHAQQNKNKVQNEVGELTAYYATEDFVLSEESGYQDGHDWEGLKYNEGDLIYDSNGYTGGSYPGVFVEEQRQYLFTYRTFDGAHVPYKTYEIPKTSVFCKTFKTNRLSATDVGKGLVFSSTNGSVRLTPLIYNGFSIIGIPIRVDEEEMKFYKNGFILNGKIKNRYDYSDIIILFPNDQGYVGFYDQGVGDEFAWSQIINGDNGKTLYICSTYDGEIDEYGRLKKDLEQVSISVYSLAYIASLDALYIDGYLYYREK